MSVWHASPLSGYKFQIPYSTNVIKDGCAHITSSTFFPSQKFTPIFNKPRQTMADHVDSFVGRGLCEHICDPEN